MSALSIDINSILELYVQLGNQRTGIAGTGTLVSLAIEGTNPIQYLDFNDVTFKTSGWTTKFAQLSQEDASGQPGYYRLLLDLSTITNLPAIDSILLAKYKVNATSPTLAVSGTDRFKLVDNHFEVRQAWTRSLTPSTLKAIVHLQRNGQNITLDGAATLAFQGYDRAGSAIVGFSGAGTLRTIGSDTFFDCSVVYDPTPGEVITVRCTITGSGSGGGTHLGSTSISFPQF